MKKNISNEDIIEMISNEYGLEQRQYELLNMLKDFNTIMQDHNIKYSLCGGTLLGAVRHDGFIPWDDDIDVMVDRSNYNKLISLFDNKKSIPSENGDTDYVLNRYLWVYRVQKEHDPREKLDAATIDIMVMDHCPDNKVVRKIKVLLIKILQGMMHDRIDLKGQSLFYKTCIICTYLLGRLFTDNYKFRLYNCCSQISNKVSTSFLTGYNDLFKLLNLHYDSDILDNIITHPFEDTELPVISKYDHYLTTQYGDYMRPPAKEDRVPIHMNI